MVRTVPVPEPRPIRYYQQKLQSNFQDTFLVTTQGWAADEQRLVDSYTELYITAGRDVHVNTQHEVLQIDKVWKPSDTETPIQPRDIFEHPSGKDIPIRTVLTNGIAGIGKTFLVRKFMLDWAEERTNQDVHLIFPFTFRALNSLQGKEFGLAELIHVCIPETKDVTVEALNYIFTALQSSGNSSYQKSRFKLLFVFDGLDESRLHLDFDVNIIPSVDITKSTKIEVLLRELISGKLLRSARLWITTRPAAANQIPSDCVDMVTEVRGFTDPQKEEYFRTRFRDEKQANSIISHMKKSRSLHIMCHIPVFCWITATVLEELLETREEEELPRTLTEMYTEFLRFQIDHTKEKYGREKRIQYIKSLAKLAFEQLQKGNLIFYERDLRESGINVSEASVYSGVFTEIFKTERRRKQEDKIDCNLSERSCGALSSVLSSQFSSVTELDLTNNNLQDSGVESLSAGLESPHCKLEALRLSGCLVTEEGCASLASALSLRTSNLRELDLSYNHPGDSGEKMLWAKVEDPDCRLETLRVTPAGVRWLTPGLRKYSCQLTVDTNTVNGNLKLSDNNRKVTFVEEDQSYPDHPDRFDYWKQLLCETGLTGRCYWEMEWRGDVYISVSYREIRRKGVSDDCVLGGNDQSWSLICSDLHGYSVSHNSSKTSIRSSSVSHRVSVYVDVPAGTLSFYRVSSDSLIHLHTFNTTFTQPLCPGFGVLFGSSVFLC
ncbi:NACHT, LRR and PYD domains-containing protein 1b allele 2-like [Acanthochromis polyacanthus]|uniref:NACHT, LRR and PYD domains-containing protein 1b allele 2-like n=1 Tax=Acanthochromis polyacanthus TaxID=80966 RepID=UPI002233EB1D|nr:NACHT, LRR and PYD domains-containing protein 1b allele 2-like [Acanthochromis polyacanthus]